MRKKITESFNRSRVAAKRFRFRFPKRFRGVLAVAVAVMLAVALVACQPSDRPTPPDPSDSSNVPGGQWSDTGNPVIHAPEFTLRDQNGVQHTLSGYRGKIIFMTFGATWCGPCIEELPDLNQLYLDHEENTQDIAVLNVVYPTKEGDTCPEGQEELTEEGIRTYVAQKNYRVPMLMDLDGSVFALYKVDSLPTTYMIDREGNVIGYLPAALSIELMEALIERALNPPSESLPESAAPSES